MEKKFDFYAYRVFWSVEDNEYIGTCIEFPSLSWLASSPESALRGIRKVVAEVVTDMQATGEKIPEPLATKKYSGRFLVRIPPERHRELSMEAHEAGISLNRLTSDLLSRGH